MLILLFWLLLFYSVEHLKPLPPIEAAVGIAGAERVYGEENDQAISIFNASKLTWSKDDLLFYYKNEWHPFHDFKEYFKGNPVFRTRATLSSGVGSYPIEVDWGTLRSDRFKITNALSSKELLIDNQNPENSIGRALGQNLSIKKAPLYVTACVEPSVVYVGDELPEITYKYGYSKEFCTRIDGIFLLGDEPNTAMQEPPQVKSPVMDTAVPGIYTVGPFGGKSANYQIIRLPATFSICRPCVCVQGDPVYNHITHLWEQVVKLQNNSMIPWNAVMLKVATTDSTKVYNAFHRTEKEAFLLHNYEVPPEKTIKFVVEYDLPEDALIEDVTFDWMAVEKQELQPAEGNSVRVVASQHVMGANYYSTDLYGSDSSAASWTSIGILLKLDHLTTNKYYEVQFSEDYINWIPVVPKIHAKTSSYQWADKGSPKTPAHPLLSVTYGESKPIAGRLYRVVECQE